MGEGDDSVNRTTTLRRIVGAAALMLMLTACGSSEEAAAPEPATPEQTAPDQAAPAEPERCELASVEEVERLADVIAAAQEEGMLRLNWGGTGLADSVPILFEDFQEYYCLDLRLEHDPQSSMATNMTNIGAEFDAGRPSATDIAWGTTVHIQQAMRGKWLDTMADYEDWSWHITPEILDGYDGEDPVAVAGYTLYGGVVYNTGVVTETLRTPEDILNLTVPIASTPIGAMFDRVGGPYDATLGEEALFEFLDRFEIAGLISCGDLDRVASGEFPVLFIACSQASYHVYKDAGAPLEFRPIEGMNIAQHNYMFLPLHAEHPNVARLFINYISSPAGQSTFAEIVKADNMFAPGSRTGAEIDALESEGFEYVFVGLQDLKDLQDAATPDYRDRVLAYFRE